jgi:hypothetical protein
VRSRHFAASLARAASACCTRFSASTPLAFKKTRPRSLKRQRSGLRTIKKSENTSPSLSLLAEEQVEGGLFCDPRSTHYLGPLPKPNLENRHGESAGLASLLRLQRNYVYARSNRDHQLDHEY